MEWASITAREALQRLKRGATAVDVRSPLEFAQGHIPDVTNFPILDNDQRHRVGLAYKEQGQDAAIALGLELVTPLRAKLISAWTSHLKHPDIQYRLLFCWRGGLRSKMAAKWLSESGVQGVRVEGGHKALRGELMKAIAAPPRLLLLSGLTGVGKTALLQALRPEWMVDLENLANHRGSSFGLNIRAVQPAQQTFENRLGYAFFEGQPEVVVEAESRMVGACVLPTTFKQVMDESPRIILECSAEERHTRIFREYVSDPLKRFSQAEVQAHLSEALARIERRLGGLRYQSIKRDLGQAFLLGVTNMDHHVPWIEALLRDYYDPLYEHGNKAHAQATVFRGDFHGVKDFLTGRLTERRGC